MPLPRLGLVRSEGGGGSADGDQACAQGREQDGEAGVCLSVCPRGLRRTVSATSKLCVSPRPCVRDSRPNLPSSVSFDSGRTSRGQCRESVGGPARSRHCRSSPSGGGRVRRGAAGSRPSPWPVPSSCLTSPWSVMAADPAVAPKGAPSLLTPLPASVLTGLLPCPFPRSLSLL